MTTSPQPAPPTSQQSSVIRFVRRGEIVSLFNVPPDRTLLEVLREDLGCTGTKEGCGEGDCGACTVVLGEANGKDLSFKAINSCIRLAHSVNGLALWTVEDIAPTLATACAALPPKGAHFASGRPSGETLAPTIAPTLTTASAALSPEGAHGGSPLHPVQQAMVDCHGSQCGFCTPGFVMSLFGLYQNTVCKGQAVTRSMAQEALSGNLCRCTGYRPILDAAQTMGELPLATLNTPDLLQQLKHISAVNIAESAHSTDKASPSAAYMAPQSVDELLRLRAKHPQAQIVAGCTDVGLWITKHHHQFDAVLDVTRVTELQRIERYRHHIAIGAAVTLSDAFAALVKDRPQLHAFASRFAGLPVRNSGTLGGNVANGSPIGDSMPLLIACGANVVLMRMHRGVVHHRELPLEALYTGYRQNVIAKDEVLAWIKVPKPVTGEHLSAYKISKRYDDDISAVCLVINLTLRKGGVVKASIGVGGVAATPVRATQTEAALTGQPWTQATVASAMAVLKAEFQPISDMRASGAYRTEVLGNLLQRYWLESQGLRHINLENFTLTEAV